MSTASGNRYYSGFNPLAIGGCALWFDAADTRTIVSNGNNVTSWASKGSVSVSITPTVGTPTTGNLSPNGLNYVNIPIGADMGFTTALNSQARSWFWVVRTTTPAANWTQMYILHPSSGITGQDQLYLLRTGSSPNFIYTIYQQPRNTIRLTANVASPVNSINIYAVVNSATSVASNAITSRGTIHSLGNNTLATGYSTASQLYTIRTDSLRTLSLDFFEILFFTRDLSVAERQQVEGYLSWKWAIRTDLPIAHPHYSIIPVARPFVPLDIAGCSLWLDAADPTTITLSGANVTQWSDKSGTANHAVTSSRFAWLGPTVTSSNSLRFTRVASTSVQMLRTQTGRQTTTDVTYIVVAKPSNDAAGANFIDLRKTTNGQALVNISSNSAGFRGSTSALQSFTVSYSTGKFNILTVQAGSNRYAAYLNGVLAGSGTSTLDMPSNDAVYTTIGAFTDLDYGVNATSANQILFTQSSEFYEVLMFNSYLSLPQIQQLEGYLANKWGLLGAPSSLITSSPISTLPSVSGCQLWLDAGDSNTFTFSSGSNISNWLDKSGNGRHATQYNTGFATYDASNRRVVITPTGQLSCPVPAGTFSSGISVFMVFQKFGANQGLDTVVSRADGNVPAPFDIYPGTRHVGNGTGNYAAFNDSLTPFRNTTTTLYFINIPAAVLWNEGINGETPRSVPRTATSGTPVYGDTATRVYIGTRGDRATSANVYVYELIFYSGSLTDTQRQNIESYLALKWDLRNLLPAGHPYSAPPRLPATHPFRTALPATAPFTPRQISNCCLWFDAADRSTITGTTQVTAWVNKGIVSTTAVNAIGSVRLMNTSDGLSFLRFPAGTELQFNAQISANSTGSFWYFYAARINTDVSSSTATIITSVLSGYGSIFEGYNFNTGRFSLFFSGAQNGVTAEIANPFNQFNIRHVFANPVSTTDNIVTVNGDVQSFNSSSTFSMSNGNVTHRISRAGANTEIDLMELIMYDTTVTANQRRQVEGYLASKWRLQHKFPSTHPYKKISPI